MNLFSADTGINKNQNTNSVNQRSGSSTTRIGARISARISKDLGNGRYLLNLGGNDTLYVESENKFSENQRVDLEVRSSSNGRVELKLLSQTDDKTTAAATVNNNDSALLSKNINLNVTTADLALINSNETQTTDEVSQTDENPEKILNTTGNTESLNSKSTTQNNTEIQLVISRDRNSGEITAVKVILPSGKAIDAELITEASESTETEKEDKTANTSIKDIIFKAIENENTTVTEQNNSAQPQSGRIRNMLMAIAEKVFAGSTNINTNSSESLSTMKLQGITLPLILTDSSLTSQALAVAALDTQNTGEPYQLQLSLPVSSEYPLQTELFSSNNISLQQTPAGELALVYINSKGESAIQQIPEESVTNITQSLPASMSETLNIPVKLGLQSMLQGVIKEDIISNPPATVYTNNTEKLTLPQNDPTKLDALIKRGGMTPSSATRDAARALLDNSLPVNRDNIQALLALSAGKSGAERSNFLNSGAKLLAMDAPLSPPLAAGLSKLYTEDGVMKTGITKINSSLGNAVQSLHQLTENSESPQQTSQQTLLNTLNKATDTLRGIPVLIDALGINSPAADSSIGNTSQELSSSLAEFVSTSARERLGTIEQLIQNATQQILDHDPVLSRLSTALDSILTKLGNLPEETEDISAKIKTAATDIPNTHTEEENLSKLADIIKKDFPELSGKDLTLNINNIIKDIPLLREHIAHPGIGNLPEFWEPVDIDNTTLQKSDLKEVKNIIEQILTSETPEHAKALTREMIKTIDKDTLRTLASAMQEIEKDEINKHPSLRHLREANTELRELGRALVAQKAENLAGSRNDPASFTTSVPFNFNNQDGQEEEGKLSMFYNKRRSSKGNWQQRVILDLNMSVLGNIIGDIQFYDNTINLNLITSNRDTVAILQSEQETLHGNLENLGFSSSIGIKLMEPKLEKEAQPESTPSSGQHLLDIQA